MSEDWEDWDCDNYVVPVLNVQNEEQLKRLKERKLVEEADNALIDELFDNKNKIPETQQNTINNIEKQKTTHNKISKQKENELKQKEFSQKLKKKKEEERKHLETFGDVIYDEYDDYVDKLF